MDITTTNEISSLLKRVTLEMKKVFFENKNSWHEIKTDQKNPVGHSSLEIDLILERLLINEIRASGIDCIIETEESGHIQLGYEPQIAFVCDPCDGSVNVYRGIHIAGAVGICAVDISKSNSILLPYSIASIVTSLFTADIFTAANSQESLLNGEKISPSKSQNLSDSLIAIDPKINSVELGESNDINEYRKKNTNLINSAGGIRRFGANLLDLCYVASGSVDLAVDIRPDFSCVHMAGIDIVKKSGAFIKDPFQDLNKIEWKVERNIQYIASGTQKLMNEVLELLNF